jgi:transposase
VHRINAESDAAEDSLRISIDVKAILKLGELSRRGKARGKEAVKAQDKDMDVKGKLVPFGILEVLSGVFTLIFGTSRETSDFLADCLELWWDERKEALGHIRELVINLDNGPSLASNRTQFVKRMIEFADRHGLEIHLVYYPPYHSKYNPVERTWGILENHWNGTLLTDRETAIAWAKTMTWKGISPIVKILEGAYQTGITIAKKAFRALENRLNRNNGLPKWDVRIRPALI